MVKVRFFSYPVNSSSFIEEVRYFKSMNCFRASLKRRRQNPRFCVVSYDILSYDIRLGL